MNEMMKAT
jgi:Ca2+-binding EF-hand superfamily protein